MSNNEKMDVFVVVTVLATACAGGGKSASENDAAFFFKAKDGIRAGRVTGVQTCALPISGQSATLYVTFTPMVAGDATGGLSIMSNAANASTSAVTLSGTGMTKAWSVELTWSPPAGEIGRAACRERGERCGVVLSV